MKRIALSLKAGLPVAVFLALANTALAEKKETRVADKPTLDQLRDELAKEVEDAAIKAKIDELTKGATVTRDGEALDPAILKNSALID